MTKVEITRRYSGFQNVSDKMSVGNFEADGNAALETYELPEGYTVANGIVYDPADIECELVPIAKGMKIISRAGRHDDKQVYRA